MTTTSTRAESDLNWRLSRNSLTGWIILAVATVVLGWCWALASPVPSSPDDEYHLGSIWCSWGQEATGCVEIAEPSWVRIVSIPALEQYRPCFAFKPELTAACQDDSVVDGAAINRANNDAYPDGYYAFMRLFVGEDVERSVVVMRLVNYLLCLGMLVVSVWLLPGRLKPRARVLLGVVAVSLPLALFLFTSVNPSGVAIAAEAATLIAAVGLLSARSPARAWLAGSWTALTVLVAGATRADALYFSVIALAVAVVATFPWQRLRIPTRLGSVWAAALPVLIALLFVHLTRPKTDLTQPAGTVTPTEGAQVSLWGNLLGVSDLYVGWYPTKLGYLDTLMPPAVVALQTLIPGILLAIGVAKIGWRRAAALALLFAAIVAVPVYWLQSTNRIVGEWVQPRYLLPLMLMLGALLVVNLPRERIQFNGRLAALLAVLLAVEHTLSLHTLMRRFVSGTDVGGPNLEAVVEWWWPSALLGPNALFILGSVAFVVLVTGLAALASGKRNPRRARVNFMARGTPT